MLNSDKIDLEKLKILILDDNPCSLELLFQILFGFGARNITRCSSTVEAKDIVKERDIDLIITADVVTGENGYEFIRWLRRDATGQIQFTPAIIVTGPTRRTHVEEARDCGAHFVISKPLRANILLERIFWVAKDKRMFIDCEAYAGPDRRFTFDGLPVGKTGRRSDDLPPEVGEATDMNLSQDELDRMPKVRRVAG